MNKFINTFTGGLDLFHDDIRWNDDAYRSAMNGILADFAIGTNPNFVISGCVPTHTIGVSLAVTAGYIYLNGEILRVEAQTFLNAGSDFKYTKVTTYDATGDRITKAGASVQTYQKNRGVVSAGVAGVTELDALNPETLADKIKAVLDLTYDTWVQPTMSTGFAHSLGEADYGVWYKKTREGNLQIVGVAYVTADNAGDVTMFTLPADYRPAIVNTPPQDTIYRFSIGGFNVAGDNTRENVITINPSTGDVNLVFPCLIGEKYFFNHIIPLDV